MGKNFVIDPPEIFACIVCDGAKYFHWCGQYISDYNLISAKSAVARNDILVIDGGSGEFLGSVSVNFNSWFFTGQGTYRNGGYLEKGLGGLF